MHTVQAALQSPSVFELLPPLDFPWAIPKPQLELWLWRPIPDDPASATDSPAARPAEGLPALPAPAAAPAVQAASQSAPACVQCPHCGVPVQLPPAVPQPGEAAGVSGRSPPLLCASHAWHAVPAPPAGAARHGSCGNGGSSGQRTHSNTWASQYVFQLDHLPGLLTRLLKDNTGKAGGPRDYGRGCFVRCCAERSRTLTRPPSRPHPSFHAVTSCIPTPSPSPAVLVCSGGGRSGRPAAL